MIPTTVYSPLGAIPVIEEIPGPKTMGQWFPESRIIKVEPSLEDRAKLQTLMHEWIHVALSDQGVYDNLLTVKQCEVLCDLLGTHLAGAILSGYLLLPDEEASCPEPQM